MICLFLAALYLINFAISNPSNLFLTFLLNKNPQLNKKNNFSNINKFYRILIL